MGTTDGLGLWFPDTTERILPNVWMATAQQSVEDAILPRIQRQELAIGIKAGIATGTKVKFQDNVVAPFSLEAGSGSFVRGMELDGGYVGISKPGMYFFTASAALNMWGGLGGNAENKDRTIALQLFHNGTPLCAAEVRSDELYRQTAQANSVVMCYPGDTLWVNWYSASITESGPSDPGATLALSHMQSLSVVLVTPTD